MFHHMPHLGDAGLEDGSPKSAIATSESSGRFVDDCRPPAGGQDASVRVPHLPQGPVSALMSRTSNAGWRDCPCARLSLRTRTWCFGQPDTLGQVDSNTSPNVRLARRAVDLRPRSARKIGSPILSRRTSSSLRIDYSLVQTVLSIQSMDNTPAWTDWPVVGTGPICRRSLRRLLEDPKRRGPRNRPSLGDFPRHLQLGLGLALAPPSQRLAQARSPGDQANQWVPDHLGMRGEARSSS